MNYRLFIVMVLSLTFLTTGILKSDGEDREFLIEQLRNDDVYVRLQAADALGKIGTAAQDAVPALVKALGDRRERVREASAKALGAIGDLNAVPGLIKSLKDESLNVRRMAIEALCQYGKSAIPLLEKALSHRDIRIRVAVTLPFARAEPSKSNIAIPVLIEGLSSQDISVRINTAFILLERSSLAEEIIPSLIEALGDSDDIVQHLIVAALACIGKPVIPMIAEAMKDGDPRLCLGATSVLAKIGTEALPVLTETLHNEKAWLRVYATSALAQIGEPAVPALIKALSDKDYPVRCIAAIALKHIGSPEALTAVERHN